MEFKFGGSADNQKTVLGHPSGLFILFFTEMWERFSYYGMRALLVIFLISSFDDQGWGWERDKALILYAWYTGLVYITPMLGGFVADKFLGYRRSIVIGAFIMTLGHLFMALETPFFFYAGLLSLIAGNGLFKPNISSIVGNLYKELDKEKDAGYTIFYMGINAGAFLGILLCGYIGEKIGWNYGFGFAGIFMFLGMLQFYFGQNIFGNIGLAPKLLIHRKESPTEIVKEDPKIVKDRLFVIGILAFFTIFFWWAFEQAGGSMMVFAKDYTDRDLVGKSAWIFKIFNTTLTIIPMLIITWILYLLYKQTFRKYWLSNSILGISFAIVWTIVIWMLRKEFTEDSTEIPASWFGILNSFFIIALAPLFSKIWASKINPSGPVKFALGLILLGLGFGILSYGSMEIPQGAKTASISIVFLILAYLFHTLGELCISPVGLAYVSKLSPPRLIGLMFGIWFIANFISNTLAGFTGSYIDLIVEKYSMATFFMIFTIIPIGSGIVMLLISKILVKKMHGIR